MTQSKTEVRKDIVWYEWLYQVSNFWNIKSLPRNRSNWRWYFLSKEKILSNKENKCIWYPIVVLCDRSWNKRYITIHSIVANAFIPNIKHKKTINHKNWIRNDNRVENLEWNTYSENIKHSYEKLNRIGSAKWKVLEKSHHKTEVIQQSLSWKQLNIRWCIKSASMALWIWYKWIVNNCIWRAKSAWWYRRLYLHNNKICS